MLFKDGDFVTIIKTKEGGKIIDLISGGHDGLLTYYIVIKTNGEKICCLAKDIIISDFESVNKEMFNTRKEPNEFKEKDKIKIIRGNYKGKEGIITKRHVSNNEILYDLMIDDYTVYGFYSISLALMLEQEEVITKESVINNLSIEELEKILEKKKREELPIFYKSEYRGKELAGIFSDLFKDDKISLLITGEKLHFILDGENNIIGKRKTYPIKKPEPDNDDWPITAMLYEMDIPE